MRLWKATTVAVILLTLSCAPRFTVYLGLHERFNTSDITLLAVDTVKVGGYTQRKIVYSMKKEIGGLERLFLAGRIKRMKKELDNISK